MIFLHHSSIEKMVHNTKGGPTCVGMMKAERSLRKMASLGTPTQWGNINNHSPWFDDARSIRFAMSTDYVNPFSNQSSTHSTCPVVLSLYNLPPWLCKK
jgi:hypothetical protein